MRKLDHKKFRRDREILASVMHIKVDIEYSMKLDNDFNNDKTTTILALTQRNCWKLG